MRNYWNQLACFKYFTHSKIVECEIKHQLSSKSGKLHKITKARFFAGLYIFSMEDLSSHCTLISTPLAFTKVHFQNSEGNQPVLLLFTFELYRKKEHTHISICGFQTQGGLKNLMEYLSTSDFSFKTFLCGYSSVVSCLFGQWSSTEYLKCQSMCWHLILSN